MGRSLPVAVLVSIYPGAHSGPEGTWDDSSMDLACDSVQDALGLAAPGNGAGSARTRWLPSLFSPLLARRPQRAGSLRRSNLTWSLSTCASCKRILEIRGRILSHPPGISFLCVPSTVALVIDPKCTPRVLGEPAHQGQISFSTVLRHPDHITAPSATAGWPCRAGARPRRPGTVPCRAATRLKFAAGRTG